MQKTNSFQPFQTSFNNSHNSNNQFTNQIQTSNQNHFPSNNNFNQQPQQQQQPQQLNNGLEFAKPSNTKFIPQQTTSNFISKTPTNQATTPTFISKPQQPYSIGINNLNITPLKSNQNQISPNNNNNNGSLFSNQKSNSNQPQQQQQQASLFQYPQNQQFDSTNNFQSPPPPPPTKQTNMNKNIVSSNISKFQFNQKKNTQKLDSPWAHNLTATTTTTSTTTTSTNTTPQKTFIPNQNQNQNQNQFSPPVQPIFKALPPPLPPPQQLQSKSTSLPTPIFKTPATIVHGNSLVGVHLSKPISKLSSSSSSSSSSSTFNQSKSNSKSKLGLQRKGTSAPKSIKYGKSTEVATDFATSQLPKPEIDPPPRYDVEKIHKFKYPYDPNSDGFRQYQFEIAQTCCKENTLVSLPTGVGKTVIGLSVIYNFFQWFPDSKMVFLVPTVNLVEQQREQVIYY